jgi:hypothetical protein
MDPTPGGERDGDGRPPGEGVSPDEPFRAALRGVEGDHARKRAQAVDGHALRLADDWRERERERIHRAALAELAALTGRTGAPPAPRSAHLDDPGALRAEVLERGEGHPAMVVAVKFKVSEHMVRRLRVADGRNAETGQFPTDEPSAAVTRRSEAQRMASNGMTERQIMAALGLSSTTQVRRALGKPT